MTLTTTPFNAKSTADEVVAGHDLSGLTAIVTGASSGIGVETARSLARAGAQVTIAVRNVEAGHKTAEDIALSTGNNSVRVAHLDLGDLASVAEFVKAWEGPLDLLINNAGIMALPELTLTASGWEMQFATNHIGHFALTDGLHSALAAGADLHGGARIVSVSSGGHMRSPVIFDDINFDSRPYDPWSAYGQSKTANVLLAVEATRRWKDDGIVANALMPGGIMTGLQKYVPQEFRDGWKKRVEDGSLVFKSTQQGASTTLVAAISPEFAHTGGHYLEDCNEAKTVPNDTEGLGAKGVKEWALDPEAANRLWELSLELIR